MASASGSTKPSRRSFIRSRSAASCIWTLSELQADLDAWLAYYNGERTHQGKMCRGRTPVQTLIAGKEVWKEKVSHLNLI